MYVPTYMRINLYYVYSDKLIYFEITIYKSSAVQFHELQEKSPQLLTIHVRMFHSKKPPLNRQTALEMLESLHNLYILHPFQQT